MGICAETQLHSLVSLFSKAELSTSTVMLQQCSQMKMKITLTCLETVKLHQSQVSSPTYNFLIDWPKES
jgi:hypothetical protein